MRQEGGKRKGERGIVRFYYLPTLLIGHSTRGGRKSTLLYFCESNRLPGEKKEEGGRGEKREGGGGRRGVPEWLLRQQTGRRRRRKEKEMKKFLHFFTVNKKKKKKKTPTPEKKTGAFVSWTRVRYIMRRKRRREGGGGGERGGGRSFLPNVADSRTSAKGRERGGTDESPSLDLLSSYLLWRYREGGREGKKRKGRRDQQPPLILLK